MENKNLPEAPVSINTTLKSEAGFEYQLTLRGSSYTSLLENLKELEGQFTRYGLSPLPRYAKSSFPKKEVEYVQDRTCPLDGAKLVYATKKDGSRYIKCENNKWDKIANKATGCQYVEWPKPLGGNY